MEDKVSKALRLLTTCSDSGVATKTTSEVVHVNKVTTTRRVFLREPFRTRGMSFSVYHMVLQNSH